MSSSTAGLYIALITKLTNSAHDVELNIDLTLIQRHISVDSMLVQPCVPAGLPPSVQTSRTNVIKRKPTNQNKIKKEDGEEEVEEEKEKEKEKKVKQIKTEKQIKYKMR